MLPSPWAYRLLLEVVQSISELGVDIWSPHLSVELKKELAKKLSDLLQESALSAEASAETPTVNANGHAKTITNGEKMETDGKETGADDEEKAVSKETTDEDEVPGKEVNGMYLNGDGDHNTDDGGKKAKDLKTQRLFDVLYLAHAFSTESPKEKNDNGLNEIQASLKADLKLETKSLDRLSRNPGEYWKRTSLLFALL